MMHAVLGKKTVAFLTASLMLSACGGGGGGTIATPTPTPIATTPFTSWHNTDLAGKAIKADGPGKQVAYDYANGAISKIYPTEDAAASAIFTFDSNSALTGLFFSSTTTPSTTVEFAVGQISALAGYTGDKDSAGNSYFTTAKSIDNDKQAVISNPKSLAWDYQSFGVWETGLNSTSGGHYGAMSVGAASPTIPSMGDPTFKGKVVGSYVDTAGHGNTVLADLTVIAHFANTPSLDFSTTNTVMASSWDGTFSGNSALNLSGTLYVNGTNSFSGQLTSSSSLMGNSTGQFYGPNAEELGGTFFLKSSDPNSVETYSGAYGARDAAAPAITAP